MTQDYPKPPVMVYMKGGNDPNADMLKGHESWAQTCLVAYRDTGEQRIKFVQNILRAAKYGGSGKQILCSTRLGLN